MRLIDADALDLDREVELADDWKTAHEIANCVKYAPTVDAVPVKHGRWKLFDSAEPQRYGCSNCSCLSWYGTYRYCPNCGSRMDLEEQDAQTEQSGK